MRCCHLKTGVQPQRRNGGGVSITNQHLLVKYQMLGFYPANFIKHWVVPSVWLHTHQCLLCISVSPGDKTQGLSAKAQAALQATVSPELAFSSDEPDFMTQKHGASLWAFSYIIRSSVFTPVASNKVLLSHPKQSPHPLATALMSFPHEPHGYICSLLQGLCYNSLSSGCPPPPTSGLWNTFLLSIS